MKYSFDSKVFDEAVTRCAAVKDGYVIQFTNRKAGDNEVYVTLSASTTHTLSNITISAVPDGEAKAMQVMVGVDFGAAVHALAPAGTTIELDIGAGAAVLSCGDARIPIKYLSQVTQLNMCSPKTDEHAFFTIETKEWKRAITQGGFAFGDYDPTVNNSVLNNIFLLPCDGGIMVVTSEGHYAASSSATIGKWNEKFTDMVKSVQGVCIPPASVKLINSCLKGESITVYLFQKQLLIKDGNDVFVITLAANNSYPMNIFDMLNTNEFDYSFEARISDIKVALNILSVNCTNVKQATMTLSVSADGVIVVSNDNENKASINNKNRTGCLNARVSICQLKDLVSATATEVDSVTICGKNGVEPVFVKGGHAVSFMLHIVA